MAKPQREIYTAPFPARLGRRQIGANVRAKYARTLEELEDDELGVRPYHVKYVPSTPAQKTFDPQQAQAADVEPTIEQKFRTLAEQWYIGTMFRSSYLDKILHPAYQKILTLGEAAVPFILRELQDAPSDWFWALRFLTDADPTTPEQAGDMEAMSAAWLDWGREKGHIR